MRLGVLGSGLALALAAGVLALASTESAKAPDDLPLGVSKVLYEITVPANAVPTQDKIALGDKLFNEKRLSVDDSVSCATCHDPARGFVDHKPQSEGIGAHRGHRNAPTVLNAMFNATQFWDGRAATLEAQAKLPILNPIEMGQRSPEDVVKKVRGIPEYVQSFRAVFGRDVNYDDLAAAIAAFERTQFAGDAPFDHFLAGDDKAIDDDAKRGWAIFNGKGRCNSCHAFSAVSPIFSDQKFHNIGIAAHKTDFITLAAKGVAMVRSGDLEQIDHLAIETDLSELGRFLVTKNLSDVGTFKTPTLRNIMVTGPYMHDGSLTTLWDVMDHYNKGGVPNPYPRRRHAAARAHRGGDRRHGRLPRDAHEPAVQGVRQPGAGGAARAQGDAARARRRRGVRPQRPPRRRRARSRPEEPRGDRRAAADPAPGAGRVRRRAR